MDHLPSTRSAVTLDSVCSAMTKLRRSTLQVHTDPAGNQEDPERQATCTVPRPIPQTGLCCVVVTDVLYCRGSWTLVKTYPSHNTHTLQCELHLETLDTSSDLPEASRHILVNEERLKQDRRGQLKAARLQRPGMAMKSEQHSASRGQLSAGQPLSGSLLPRHRPLQRPLMPKGLCGTTPSHKR